MRTTLAGFLNVLALFIIAACSLGAACAEPFVFSPETLTSPRSVGLTDDGKVAMIATDSSVVLWDVEAKKMIKPLGNPTLPAKAPAVISSSGRYVVATTSRNKVVVWDTVSDTPVGSVDTWGGNFGLSEDGKYLFSSVSPSGDGKSFDVHIFDVATLKLSGVVKNVWLMNRFKGIGVVGANLAGDLVRINSDGSAETLVKGMAAMKERVKEAAHANQVTFVTISDQGALVFAAYGAPSADNRANMRWQFVTVDSGDIQIHPKIFRVVGEKDEVSFYGYRVSGSYVYASDSIYNLKNKHMEVLSKNPSIFSDYMTAYGNSDSNRYILFSTHYLLRIYDTEDQFGIRDIELHTNAPTVSFVDDKTGAVVMKGVPAGGQTDHNSHFQAFDITSGENTGECVVPRSAEIAYDSSGTIVAISGEKNVGIECNGNLSMGISHLDRPPITDKNVHYRSDDRSYYLYSRLDYSYDRIEKSQSDSNFSVLINRHSKNDVILPGIQRSISINHVRRFYVSSAIYSRSSKELIVSDTGGNIDFYDYETGKLSKSISPCAVKDLQEGLLALNYKIGKPDGKFGKKTKDSILALVRDVDKSSRVNDWLGEELDETALIDVGCSILELNAKSTDAPMAISEDGRIFAYVRRGRLFSKSVRLVSTSDFSVVDEFDLGEERGVTSIALDRDGSRVAIGFRSGVIRFRDVASHKDEFSLASLGGEATQLRFPGGEGVNRYFSAVVGSAIVGGQTVLIDLEKQREVVRIARTEDGKMVFITPAGYFAAFNGGEKLLQVAYGNRALGIENAYDVLSRPDLVFAHIKGDDAAYDEAASKLDLASLFDNNLPPTVTKTELAPSPSKDGTFAAQAEIEARSGGVGKVVFMVNGIAQGVVQQDGAKAGESVKVSKDLQLYDGDNKVEVVAYTSDGRIASNPFVIETKATVAASKPRLHVAVVAVNDYDDPRNVLKYAVPDGRSISSVFRQLGSGIYGDTSSYFLLDKEVNKPKLEAFFADIASKVRPSDIFVLFFAGHGVTESGQYYFIPADFRYRNEDSIMADGVSQGDLQKWLSGIVAEKSIIMFDTCESGTLTNLDLSTRGLTEANAIEKLNRAVGRNVIAAASATEAAIEGYKGHGLFTYSFMEAAASGDRNGDHLVDLTEIIQFVDNRVPQIAMQAFGQMQIPQVRMQGANFPLMNAGTPEELASAGDFIPSRNTHVVVKETAVFADAALSQATGETLTPGTRVGIIKTEGNAALLSRDGNRVGFVEADSLVTLQ